MESVIESSTELKNWQEIIAAAPEQQTQFLKSFFEASALMPEGPRRLALEKFAEFTSLLNKDQYRAVLTSGLKAWLRMKLDDSRKVVNSFQAVIDAGTGTAAWRRVLISQSISRELSNEEQHQLHELFPESEPEPAATRLKESSTTAPSSTKPKSWLARLFGK